MGSAIAVLMPISRPLLFSSTPPEFPARHQCHLIHLYSANTLRQQKCLAMHNQAQRAGSSVIARHHRHLD